LNDQHKKQTSCQILLETNLGSLPLSLRWDISPVNVTLKCHAKRKSRRLQNFRRTCWSLFWQFGWDESVSEWQTVNSIFYAEVLKHVTDVKKWKRPETLIDNWMLYHNNGPCHTSLAIQHFLMTNQIPTTPSHCIHQISLCATSGSYWPQD
jgi:hypothetical protein